MKFHFKDFGYPMEVELVVFDEGKLTIGYYSKSERKRYMLQSDIDVSKNLMIGTAPYGKVAIWNFENLKCSLIQWLCAEPLLNQKDEVINSCRPPLDLFDNYMKQFHYRYLVLFEKWYKGDKKWGKADNKGEMPMFDNIEEMLYDGTHDKLHDGGLMKYHQAGKPRKLRVQWHIGKTEYSAYLWFDDERIRDVFDMFYGAHPETKTDFLIRIDAEKKKYELALYRYGLKEPQVISEDVYQLLVFKNKFEDHRSENYNQERGAWIW